MGGFSLGLERDIDQLDDFFKVPGLGEDFGQIVGGLGEKGVVEISRGVIRINRRKDDFGFHQVLEKMGPVRDLGGMSGFLAGELDQRRGIVNIGVTDIDSVLESGGKNQNPNVASRADISGAYVAWGMGTVYVRSLGN